MAAGLIVELGMSLVLVQLGGPLISTTQPTGTVMQGNQTCFPISKFAILLSQLVNGVGCRVHLQATACG